MLHKGKANAMEVWEILPACSVETVQKTDQLFFVCSFTKKIWRQIIGLCLVSDIPISWDELLCQGIRNLKGQSFRVSLCKVARWPVVYHIWIQRNSRIHVGVMKIEEQMEKLICREVKARSIGKKQICNSILNRTLCIKWGISLFALHRAQGLFNNLLWVSRQFLCCKECLSFAKRTVGVMCSDSIKCLNDKKIYGFYIYHDMLLFFQLFFMELIQQLL